MDEKWQKIHFEQIIEENRGILFKVARIYCLNEFDRQDLVQEIMIQIWKSMDRYDDRFKISTWIYRISLNVAISFYRKNKGSIGRQISLDASLMQIPQIELKGSALQVDLLLQFIRELKEIDKALMFLYLQEKNYKEIAEILGISQTNVATKLERIKKVLKQKFDQHNNN